MQISVMFESLAEFEEFRVSGKKTRTKKEEAEEAGTAPQAAQSIQGFTPPATGMTGFPSSAPSAPAGNPLVKAITEKLAQVISTGQTKAEDATVWFRQQCGPDAAAATLDQITSIFLPRLPEAQLKTVAQQLGITG